MIQLAKVSIISVLYAYALIHIFLAKWGGAESWKRGGASLLVSGSAQRRPLKDKRNWAFPLKGGSFSVYAIILPTNGDLMLICTNLIHPVLNNNSFQGWESEDYVTHSGNRKEFHVGIFGSLQKEKKGDMTNWWRCTGPTSFGTSSGRSPRGRGQGGDEIFMLSPFLQACFGTVLRE